MIIITSKVDIMYIYYVGYIYGSIQMCLTKFLLDLSPKQWIQIKEMNE